MKVSASPCVNLPAVDWQDWLCSGAQALPTVYAVTNGFTTAADPHFAWIISLNNEFVQIPGCNTGPPNQSLGPHEYPFSVSASSAALQLSLLHDAREYCGKIAYVSASYIRGVQGDAQTRLMGWKELSGRTLELDFDVERVRGRCGLVSGDAAFPRPAHGAAVLREQGLCLSRSVGGLLPQLELAVPVELPVSGGEDCGAGARARREPGERITASVDRRASNGAAIFPGLRRAGAAICWGWRSPWNWAPWSIRSASR